MLKAGCECDKVNFHIVVTSAAGSFGRQRPQGHMPTHR